MDLSRRLDLNIQDTSNEQLEKSVAAKLKASSSADGAFGQLADIAQRAALVLNTPTPAVHNPALLIFAGDHGIASEKVSRLSVSGTSDLVMDFLNENSVVNLFKAPASPVVRVIDAGVDHSFEGSLAYWLHQGSRFFNRKLANGTRNFMEFPAMTSLEAERAMKLGMDMLIMEHQKGCNTIGLGDVGVGNTTSASALCAAVVDVDAEEFLLGSTGDASLFQHKLRVVKKALGKHPKTHDPLTLLTLFGGYEIVALVGAMLKAAEQRMLILIDGFVSATALLLASRIYPELPGYCIFCSGSEDPAHQRLLKEFDAKPLLKLDLNLGQGSGVALAFPLILNALALLNEE